MKKEERTVYCMEIRTLKLGICAGGRNPTFSNVIEYITISALGNATDFGNLTSATSYVAGCNNFTRGAVGGGSTPTIVNTIDFITMASAGDAADFGDLSQARRYLSGLSNAHGGLSQGY